MFLHGRPTCGPEHREDGVVRGVRERLERGGESLEPRAAPPHGVEVGEGLQQSLCLVESDALELVESAQVADVLHRDREVGVVTGDRLRVALRRAERRVTGAVAVEDKFADVEHERVGGEALRGVVGGVLDDQRPRALLGLARVRGDDPLEDAEDADTLADALGGDPGDVDAVLQVTAAAQHTFNP